MSWRFALAAPLIVVLVVAASHSGNRHPVTRVPPVPSTTSTTVAPTTTTTEPPVTAPRASRGVRRTVAPKAGVPTDPAFWRLLSNCESPSNARSRNGLYGGYFQMTASSWRGGGGDGVPESHTWEQQQAVAYRWALMTNPYRQWPTCWPRAMRGWTH